MVLNSRAQCVCVCVSVCVSPQVVCGCQVPSCQGQTDILSSAASPAWARLVPPDHVTAFSQYKQPYITHQLIPARYKCGSAWTLQLSLTENDRNGMCQLNILVHFNGMLTYIYSIINYIWPVICLHNALRKIICYILLLQHIFFWQDKLCQFGVPSFWARTSLCLTLQHEVSAVRIYI